MDELIKPGRVSLAIPPQPLEDPPPTPQSELALFELSHSSQFGLREQTHRSILNTHFVLLSSQDFDVRLENNFGDTGYFPLTANFLMNSVDRFHHNRTKCGWGQTHELIQCYLGFDKEKLNMFYTLRL